MAPDAPRVAFVTLGCKVNRAESEAVLGELLGAGWEVAVRAADADVVIINTCTVTAEADHKVRKAVHRALRECAGPVVVTGCAAVIGGPQFAALDPRVVVECDKTRLAVVTAEAAATGPDHREPSGGMASHATSPATSHT
ncbi:MAG: hypothetical protein FDZ70_06315, partial [Actinobacteria bacterium]